MKVGEFEITMKKQVFRPHIVLVVEGRIYWLLQTWFVFWYSHFLYSGLDEFLNTLLWIPVAMLTVYVVVVAIGFYYYCHHYFWEKLTVTENEIIWSCLFRKRVIIPFGDINRVSVQQFLEGNSMAKIDLYKTGFRYIVISVDKIPNKRIDKIRSGEGLIKFAFTQKLAVALVDKVPSPQCNVLKPYITYHKNS